MMYRLLFDTGELPVRSDIVFLFLLIIIYGDLHLGWIQHIYKPDGHNN